MSAKSPSRCAWVSADPLYISYHDTEWGVPVGLPSKTEKPSPETIQPSRIIFSSLDVPTGMSRSDKNYSELTEVVSESELSALERSSDKTQFEFLTLESAQAGLSWITILKRREGYRRVFHNFDPKLVAKMSQKDIDNALQDSGIIRNRLKVKAAVKNAQVFLEIQKEFGSFSNYIWGFVGGKTVQNNWQNISQVPATSKESDELSKDLKRRGMSFVGSTIMYAHMQATGLVNDHTANCFRSHSPN